MPEHPQKTRMARGNIESCGASTSDQFDKSKCVLQIEALERCKTARAGFPE